MALRHSKHAFSLKSECKPRKTASRARQGCLTPSPRVIGVLTLSLACSDPFALVLGTRHPLCIAFALNCIFLCGFACSSCISPVFLVSRLNRLGGDSLFPYLSLLRVAPSVKASLFRTPFGPEPRRKGRISQVGL